MSLTGGSPAWSGTSSPGRQNGRGSRDSRRPRPLCRPPRDPAPQRRPARKLPGDRRPAHLVLGQQLLGQATARAPHRRAARTAPPTCLGAPGQVFHFRPRAASPPCPRGNRSWGHRLRARPLLKVPRRSLPGSAGQLAAPGCPRRAGGGARSGAGRSRAEPRPQGPAPPPRAGGRTAHAFELRMRSKRHSLGMARLGACGKCPVTSFSTAVGGGGGLGRGRGPREVSGTWKSGKARDSQRGQRRPAAHPRGEDFFILTLPLRPCRTCMPPPEMTEAVR